MKPNVVTKDLEAVVDKREVLNHGFVELVDFMGDDYRILQSARVSTGGDSTKGDKKDKGLIRYLYKNKHLTPFEQVTLTWHVKCPIFVARQWMRHRTQSFNEYSARYSELSNEYYEPETLYTQSKQNHQGISNEPVEHYVAMEVFYTALDDSRGAYEYLLEHDVAKEQARMILPVSQFTEFYVTMNLRNLFHFLELRMDSHAQKEIRVYANAMFDMLKQLNGLKWSVAAFDEFRELEEAYREAINVAGLNTEDLLTHLRGFVKYKDD